MTNNEVLAVLEKAGITTQTTGGLLNAEQSRKFIETTVDQSQFLKEIRVEQGIGTSRDLDNIGVGTRLLHKPVEDEAPADDKLRGVSIGKRSLVPVEVMLPYNISLKWLEENLERKGAEDTVNRAFSMQFATDLTDLALNGDTATDIADPDYIFLAVVDGLIKKIKNDTDKQFYNRSGSTDWKGTVFPQMIRLLPNKYKADPTKVKLYVSYEAEEEYREQLAERATALGDTYLVEKNRARYKGVIVEPLPHLVYGQTLLTTPKNLAIGFGREISRWRQFVPRKRRVEYTISAKIDYNFVLSDWNVYSE